RGKAIWRKRNRARARFSTFCRESLLNDDVGKTRVRADGWSVVQFTTIDGIWILAKNFAVCRSWWRWPLVVDFAALGYNDSEQLRNILIAVETVRNKKWHHNHVWGFSQFPPVRYKRRFLHVNIQHRRVFAERADLFRFALCCDCAVFIQIGSVSNNQQAGFGWNCAKCHVACALEQQLRHQWMISNRLTISPDLST